MSALPIVWVPGHLCGAWLYAAQVAAFPAHPAILAETGRDDSPAGMARRLLDDAPERFVLAGLSMGGMVAMEAMAAAPGRVAAALLMDTDPLPARDKELAFRDAQRREVAEHGLEPAVRAFASRFFGHAPEVSERHLEAVVGRMAATPRAVYECQARALDGRRDMAPLLDGFAAPVTILVGGRDVICPPKVHAPLRAALPGARYLELPETGHLASLEAPEAVSDALAALLAEAGER